MNTYIFILVVLAFSSLLIANARSHSSAYLVCETQALPKVALWADDGGGLRSATFRNLTSFVLHLLPHAIKCCKTLSAIIELTAAQSLASTHKNTPNNNQQSGEKKHSV